MYIYMAGSSASHSSIDHYYYYPNYNPKIGNIVATVTKEVEGVINILQMVIQSLLLFLQGSVMVVKVKIRFLVNNVANDIER